MRDFKTIKQLALATSLVAGFFVTAVATAGEVEDSIAQRLTNAVPGLKISSVR